MSEISISSILHNAVDGIELYSRYSMELRYIETCIKYMTWFHVHNIVYVFLDWNTIIIVLCVFPINPSDYDSIWLFDIYLTVYAKKGRYNIYNLDWGVFVSLKRLTMIL